MAQTVGPRRSAGKPRVEVGPSGGAGAFAHRRGHGARAREARRAPLDRGDRHPHLARAIADLAREAEAQPRTAGAHVQAARPAPAARLERRDGGAATEDRDERPAERGDLVLRERDAAVDPPRSDQRIAPESRAIVEAKLELVMPSDEQD